MLDRNRRQSNVLLIGLQKDNRGKKIMAYKRFKEEIRRLNKKHKTTNLRYTSPPNIVKVNSSF